MEDLISREAVIDAIRKPSREDGYIDMPHEYVTDAVRALPSAQPDLQLTCNQLATDCISRQAAIEALSHMMDTDGFRDGWAVSRANVDCMLRSLPSAQPEIIRCKDCKHWLPHEQFGYDEDNEEYHDYCAKLIPEDKYYAFRRHADEWCNRAERREE